MAKALDPTTGWEWVLVALAELPPLPYHDLDPEQRDAVDHAARLLRARAPDVYPALMSRDRLHVAAAVATALGVPDTDGMGLTAVLDAIATAVEATAASAVTSVRRAQAADSDAALAAVVATLPLPTGESGQWTCRTATMAWLRSRRSVHTRRAYLRDLTDWLTWLAEHDVDPRAVGRSDVDTWLRTLTASPRPLASTSVNRRLSTLSSWYTCLADHDLVGRNPVATVERPRVDRDYSPTLGLTVAEVRALMRAADMEVAARTAKEGEFYAAALRRDRVLVGMLASLGLRVGEAIALDVSNVRINQGHRTVLVDGKGGRTRELPVPSALARHLEPLLVERRRDLARRHLADRFAPKIAEEIKEARHLLVRGILPPQARELNMTLDQARAGLDIGRTVLAASAGEELTNWLAVDALTLGELEQFDHRGPLFATGAGKPLSQAYVFDRVRRLARSAGLPAAERISPRSLRRSAAMAALDDGAPLRDVQEFLGHADPRTTRRHNRSKV